jgi:hypothetical protein
MWGVDHNDDFSCGSIVSVRSDPFFQFFRVVLHSSGVSGDTSDMIPPE